MTTGNIVFVIPEDVGAIADLLSDAGATVDDKEGLSSEEILALLAANTGRSVFASVEDSDDPLSPINDVSAILTKTRTPHWGVFDAFAERSRGMRVQGRLYLLEPGAETVREETIPWQDGPPDLTSRSLTSVGFDRDEAKRIENLFYDLPRAEYAASDAPQP